MTTIVRKFYPGGRCFMLGEVIEDTATRYYYRRNPSAELAFVDKSPSIHIAPCPACADWYPKQTPQNST